MSRRARMLCSVTKPRDATKPRSGSRRRGATSTTAFGAGRREGHDASAFYSRFAPPKISDDETVNRPGETLEQLGRGRVFNGSGAEMSQLPDNSVALVVTSPPYFVGKEYEAAVTGSSAAGSDPALPTTYLDYLEVLREVFAECTRVLEPGGRIAVNVANLGRKPYRSLSADVVDILGNDLGLLLRGEIIWEKSETSSGSCAWGSFAKASNPVLRDMTERVVIASKGRFSRALSAAERTRRGLPVQSTLTNDEFMEVTRDVWRIDAESARRVGHPAPFPVDLPRRLIDLYTYSGDIVVDPFNGSGTTVVAAARTGRIGVGYDLDADYVALAEQRLAQELERVDDLEALSESLADADPDVRRAAWSKLGDDDRAEHIHRLAVDGGRKVLDVASEVLVAAGFDEPRRSVRAPSGALDADLAIHTGPGGRTDPGSGEPWLVEVGGSFTTSRPGLHRTDAVWRLLGRLTAMRSDSGTGRPPLVLTPCRPPSGSPADKALRAAGPGLAFDVIELFDPDDLARLATYAAEGADARPVAGFWTEADLDRA